MAANSTDFGCQSADNWLLSFTCIIAIYYYNRTRRVILKSVRKRPEAAVKYPAVSKRLDAILKRPDAVLQHPAVFTATSGRFMVASGRFKTAGYFTVAS